MRKSPHAFNGSLTAYILFTARTRPKLFIYMLREHEPEQLCSREDEERPRGEWPFDEYVGVWEDLDRRR
jgi:hypothetical protein